MVVNCTLDGSAVPVFSLVGFVGARLASLSGARLEGERDETMNSHSHVHQNHLRAATDIIITPNILLSASFVSFMWIQSRIWQ